MKNIAAALAMTVAVTGCGVLAGMPDRVGEKPVQVYVSPGGSDANPGTIEKPLATLAAARDALRAIKAGSGLPAGGATVWLRGCAAVVPVAKEWSQHRWRDGGEPHYACDGRFRQRGLVQGGGDQRGRERRFGRSHTDVSRRGRQIKWRGAVE